MDTSTADRILDCAQGLVIAGGYSGFSYADIAAVVGIRKASIHHHFPSKVDLMVALVRRYRSDLQDGLTAMERNAPTPLDALQLYAGWWEACISDASMPFCLSAMLASELPALPPALAAEVQGHFRQLSAWLTGLIERGVAQRQLVAAEGARTSAEGFMASVHGAMLSARVYGTPETFSQIVGPALARLRA
jgi:TetR/AcrR family transcriptional regulator, transcriptional repressor for nem operon